MKTHESVTESNASNESADALGAKFFFFTSLVFLLLGSLMLAGRSNFLLSPVLTGHGLSWLLILLFGCGLPGVFGVLYWSIPKVFGTRLFSEKFVFLHYGFHYVGFFLVLLSVVWPGFGRGDMGMTFIACGALVLAVNLARTFHRPTLPDVASAFLAASVFWLLVVALMGVPFAEKAPLSVLDGTNWSAAWLVLALAGVLLNLPMGIALRVSPFALGAPVTNTGTAWYAFVFTNVGLAWMFAATTFGPPSFLLFCSGIYVFGVLLFFVRYFVILQNRTVRVLPWDGKVLLTSLSLVPVAGCMLLVSAWEHMRIKAESLAASEIPGVISESGEEASAGALPVEYLPVDGALVLTCLLAVAVPAIVALGFGLMRIEKGHIAKANINLPLKTRLAEQILLAAYFNYACGVLLVIPGAWVGIAQMLSLGSLFLVMGALGFFVSAVFTSRIKPLDENAGAIFEPDTPQTIRG